MVLLPTIALLSYTAKEGGIQQNVLTMIPSGEWCAVVVNILMYISILCSYPIYCPPINEIIEASGRVMKREELSIIMNSGTSHS